MIASVQADNDIASEYMQYMLHMQCTAGSTTGHTVHILLVELPVKHQSTHQLVLWLDGANPPSKHTSTGPPVSFE
jgi:hypothetical protein